MIRNCFFFEDLPYALETNIESRLRKVIKGLTVDLEEQCLDISDEIGKKIDLICLYKTQYDRTYAERIKQYARKLAGRREKFHERCWTLKS